MDREQARELMNGFCRVCDKCNGRACAGEVPGMGGTGSGSSFIENYDSLRKLKLNMRVLHNGTTPDTTTELWGEKIDIPVLAAPIGGVKFNMSEKVSEKDYLTSVVKGCRASGTIACAGDGAPDHVFETDLAVINKQQGMVIPFLKPWRDEILINKLERLKNETDVEVIGIDVDSIGLSTIKSMGKEINPRSAEELMQVLGKFPFKYILKGIMTPQEAKSAVEVGVDAIVVSNHGGRVLDFTPGVAEVLSDIKQEVGDDISILADGGIRSGIDVLKMIALGADLVMIGRPISIAAFSDLDDGVSEYLHRIKSELEKAMLLTGCNDIDSIDREILYQGENIDRR